jgi:ribosome-associated heat shock protein Hsp15
MADGQRIDKWLWFCRFVKSRSLAQALVEQGAVRVNRVKVERPSLPVKPGDVVTLTVHGRVSVVRVAAAGVRRGPAVEARGLYVSLNSGETGGDAAAMPQT